MNRLIITLLFSLLVYCERTVGNEMLIGDVDALEAAVAGAEPGDSIVLREGEWRDAAVVLTGKGTQSAPITLKAATPGKTILTGKSTLRIGGEFLVVEGLAFKDPDFAVSDLIQFRKDSKNLSKHCRLTNCSIFSTLKAGSSDESHWLGIYGSNNRVDHCAFEGKSGKGTTFVVWLGEGNEGGHMIDHNYFGRREALGKNGGETIRIGDSKTSMQKAGCIIEKNLFEKCNGEAECISNKSCGNIYRENAFIEVSGTVTLRHGNACVVENNVFLGNGARGTGGVRVIGEDHLVRGNYFENLTGDDARAAISLMMGIPNSPAHRYFQVQRARIENNTIVDCKHPILIGLSDDKDATLAPTETVFSGNKVVCPNVVVVEARCSLDGVAWSENIFMGKAIGILDTPGIELRRPAIMALKAIARSEVGTSW